MVTFCMFRDFLLFAGVRVQIIAVSSTLCVTDHKHVLLICCDISGFMFFCINPPMVKPFQLRYLAGGGGGGGGLPPPPS